MNPPTPLRASKKYGPRYTTDMQARIQSEYRAARPRDRRSIAARYGVHPATILRWDVQPPPVPEKPARVIKNGARASLITQAVTLLKQLSSDDRDLARTLADV